MTFFGGEISHSKCRDPRTLPELLFSISSHVIGEEGSAGERLAHGNGRQQLLATIQLESRSYPGTWRSLAILRLRVLELVFLCMG